MTRPDPLDPILEKLAALDQDVGTLKAKDELRAEKERKSQVELAVERALPADLVATETNVWRRFSPFRDRWPDIAKFDERVAALEMRQAAVADDLRELHKRARVAPDRDAEALAEWELRGRQGDRPEPSLPTIEKRLQELKDEREGLDRAVARVLHEKASYVQRHRRRLKKEARGDVEEATKRYLQLIDELAAAREDLRSRRRNEVWASLYPGGEAMAEPPDSLAGGRKKPLQQAGFTGPVAPDRLFDALRADADWLREACTNEQAAAIAGVDPRHRPGTVWVDDPGEKRKRAERMAQWASRP